MRQDSHMLGHLCFPMSQSDSPRVFISLQNETLDCCSVINAILLLFLETSLFPFFEFMWFLCLLSWTKERRVLLVKSFEKKKWVVVRPLPFSRTYPQQYDVSSSLIFFSTALVHYFLFPFSAPSPLSHAESS